MVVLDKADMPSERGPVRPSRERPGVNQQAIDLSLQPGELIELPFDVFKVRLVEPATWSYDYDAAISQHLHVNHASGIH
jgi:hypothetical protein